MEGLPAAFSELVAAVAGALTSWDVAGWVDRLAAVVVASAALHGFLAGLTGLVLPAAALAAGLYLAGGGEASAAVGRLVGTSDPLVLAASVVLATLLAGTLVRALLHRILARALVLGLADRLLGAAAAITAVCVLLTVAAPLTRHVPEGLRSAIEDSRVMAAAGRVAAVVEGERIMERMSERVGGLLAAGMEEFLPRLVRWLEDAREDGNGERASGP